MTLFLDCCYDCRSVDVNMFKFLKVASIVRAGVFADFSVEEIQVGKNEYLQVTYEENMKNSFDTYDGESYGKFLGEQREFQPKRMYHVEIFFGLQKPEKMSAALEKIAVSEVAPPVVARLIDEGTKRLLVVMDGQRTKSLREAVKEGLSIFHIAVEALDLLNALHNEGWVHRDINMNSMVFWQANGDEKYVLKLIGFRKAQPLSGSGGVDFTNSRRFDMLQLAELLLQASGDDQGIATQLSSVKSWDQLKGLKEKREFNFLMPTLLKDFYRYCLSINHDDSPDYELWIHKFKNHRLSTIKSWLSSD